jgi:DNA-binding NarL/FixJ family response regulator
MYNEMDFFFDFVEDNPEFSRHLILALETFSKDIRQYPSAEEYLQNINREPSILFTDIRLPGMDGIQLTQIVKEKYPNVKIVVLSALDSDEILFKALRMGAIGYILKSDLNKLPTMILDILNGGAVITPTLALRVLKSFQEPKLSKLQGYEKLTSREVEILQELISGMSLKEVSEELDISMHTVSAHTKSIYRKLQVNNRIQLLKRAEELGLN